MTIVTGSVSVKETLTASVKMTVTGKVGVTVIVTVTIMVRDRNNCRERGRESNYNNGSDNVITIKVTVAI